MNITLIGMPGVGKSSIGRQLAKRLQFVFLDADAIIEKADKDVVNKMGNKRSVINRFEFLKECGYNVKLRRGVDSIREEDYSESDCVLAHPTPKIATKLDELIRKYPYVGLVITTKDPDNFRPQKGGYFENLRGIYVLESWYNLNHLSKCIKYAVSAAKDRSKHCE